MRFLIILTVFFTLSAPMFWGCSLHRPQSTDLPMTLPNTYQTDRTASDQIAIPEHFSERWWLRFEDPNLNQLMDDLFAANLDLPRLVARLKQTHALLWQSKADRLPAMDLTGSAGRAQQLQMGGETIGTLYSLSAIASFEVDLWNKLSARNQARKMEATAARGDLEQLFMSLSAQAADLYYLMIEQRAQLALIDQTVAARNATLKLVERRFREGLVSALDLYQARQTLAAANARRPEVESILATTSHSLAILIGQYPTASTGGQLAVLPDLPETFPTGLPSELLQNRPDIRAAMWRLKAADVEIGAAMADRFPSINLVADYGRSGSDFDTILTGTVWNLSANLFSPLVDWGRRKAEVSRSEAVFEERFIEYQQTVLNAFKDVEDALVNNRSAMRSIERIHIEAAAAEDALRLSTDRYMDGLSDYLPVLTAQTTYFDTKSRLLTAQRQLVSARISLARGLGGHWMAAATDRHLKGSLDVVTHNDP